MCTVSWRNRTNTHSFGATRQWHITSAEGCLRHCVVTSACVAVDVDYKYVPARCWVYRDPTKLYYTAPISNVVQYRVVRRVCRHDPDGRPL